MSALQNRSDDHHPSDLPGASSPLLPPRFEIAAVPSIRLNIFANQRRVNPQQSSKYALALENRPSGAVFRSSECSNLSRETVYRSTPDVCPDASLSIQCA